MDYSNKRSELQSKMNERHQARLKKFEVKKQIEEQDNVVEEKSSFFALKFSEEHHRLTSMALAQNISITERSDLTDYFDSLTTAVLRLQKFFNDSIAFLTSYEARKYQEQINDLKQQMADTRLAMIPKKKFAFKSRSRKNDTTAKTPSSTDALSAVEKYSAKAKVYEDGVKIEGKNNETITLLNPDLEKRDISLMNLTKCHVLLYGAPGTVHITNCNSCTFTIGPVSGSVFVDKCTECKISAGCQQLRVHHTTDTNFFLHVTSRAIIEDTSSVTFAPYNIDYPEKEEHFEISGLDLTTNNWNQVDDFNWLAMSTPSPNWKLADSDQH